MEDMIYFATVRYDNNSVQTEIFTRDDDRQRWINKHRRGMFYEGIRIVAVVQGEGSWMQEETSERSA
jgi:hypothetical protein